MFKSAGASSVQFSGSNARKAAENYLYSENQNQFLVRRWTQKSKFPLMLRGAIF